MRIKKLFCVMTIFVLIVLWTVSASGQSGSEPTPVPQETLDAAVNMLFQQTADAILNQTAAADAAPDETATAQAFIAPTQTLDALFQQAMTATAQVTIPDYDDYSVVNVQELPLLAAPAQSAAHLSPDGTQFVHIRGTTFCFYTLSETNEWLEDACIELEREVSGADAEEIYWSPDSQWLTLPTFREAFLFLRDTEIRIMNTETFEVVVLTDDGEDGNLLDDDFSGYFDTAARWRDEDTLVFLRSRPDDDFQNTYLMQMGIAAAEPQELAVLPAPSRLSTFALTVSEDGSQAAYNIAPPSSNPENGIWTIGLSDLEPRQVIEIEEQARLPMNLAFSANGNYLLSLNAQGSVRNSPPISNIEVVDIAAGEIIPIDSSQFVVGAGWSPRGTALAYIVRDATKPENSGLYISPTPGQPGQQVLQGEFYPPTCCLRVPLVWADNDMILIGRGGEEGVLLVQVGTE